MLGHGSICLQVQVNSSEWTRPGSFWSADCRILKSKILNTYDECAVCKAVVIYLGLFTVQKKQWSILYIKKMALILYSYFEILEN